MNGIVKFALLAALALPTAVFAEKHPATHEAATALSEGEVKKIDLDAGKITIKHGPLVNLNMEGMTMMFKVRDPAMLKQVKVGDKIRFLADNQNGALTVMQMATVK